MRKFLSSLSALFFTTLCAHAEQVVFSEIMYHPAGTKPEFIELWNISRTPLDCAKWRFTEGITYEFPDFAGSGNEHILQPLERIVVSAADPETTRTAYEIPPGVRIFGPWTGALNNAGERVTLHDKNGSLVCTVDFKDGNRWPKAADGTGHSLVLSNENRQIDDFRVWKASNYAGGTPGTTEISGMDPVANPEVGVGQSAALINYGDTWKYSVPTADPGTSWRGLAFDDGGWAAGPGLIGFEESAIPAPGIQTPLPNENRPTYLFRKTFSFNGNPTGARVAIDQIVDDGVTYYLNGQLLGSVRHTPGAWNNFASSVVGNAAEEQDAASGPAVGLVNGTNVLAAEVHQNGSGSSDLVFGARLKITTASSVVINEVYPSGASSFIEFYNSTAAPVNLQGYFLSDSPANPTKYQIGGPLAVPAGGFATISFSEAQLTSGATTTVYLTAPDGTTALSAISAPIPSDGRSLGRMPAGSADWFLFVNRTPGAPNASLADVADKLRLTEIHFAGNVVDWIELHNRTSAPVSLGGLYIASQADLSDKVPLTGSVAANSFATFDTSFPVDASGDVALFLTDSAGNVISTAEVERKPGRDSMQALYPAVPATIPSYESVRATPEWYSATEHTRDAANSVQPEDRIVITEIMFDPPAGRQAGEFIELHNKSAGPVSLAGWKLRGGIDFDFGPDAVVAAGGYLVIAANKAYFQQSYAGVAAVGDWIGKLGNDGDLIRLIDASNNLVDEVDYRAGGDWPTLASGQGSSMELIHPSMDNNRASAWRASDESAKSTFQTYSVTGTYLQMNSLGVDTDYKELHFFLVGDAHAAIRNVTLRQNGTGTNVITNGTTHATDGSSASGWLMQGTHWASHIDGNGVIQLIADGHGDNRANRVEIDCTGLIQGGSYTLQFEARWISGKPRLIAQTWDHSIGRSFLLPVPNGLGTPGATNTAAGAAPPAQVDSILHQPAVPTSNDPVKVTARVTSANPLATVEVLHRASDANNANPWVSSPMFDNGTNGDAVPNDGVYTATLTQHQVNGRVVEFYVRANATAGGSTQLPRQGEQRPALWMVDNRTMPTTLRRQRFVVSLYDRDALNTSSGQSPKFQYDFPRLSNHYFNATFIHEERDVYYHAEIRKAGSPWTRSDGSNLDRGKWKLPYDRIFRNRYKSTYDNDAGNARHHNRIIRYWLYLFGHPVNENEFIHQVINTDGIAVREDVEPVGNDLLDRSYPSGNDGQLMRSDDEWWFSDTWSRSNRNADWSYKGTDSTVRYHTEWMARSREADYDYSPLIEFFRTVSNSSSTETQLNRVIDPQLTLMMAAVRGYAQDWDSLTLDRGKNGFFYRKITDGRWMFLHWDSDLSFGDSNGSVVGSLAGWGTYINKPWTRRIFNYYLTELLSKYTKNSPRMDAWFQAEEDSSSAYTISRSLYETWFTNREARIITEINNSAGDGVTGAYTAPFIVSTSSGGTTTGATATINGFAPSRAFTIRVEGQPDAVLTWTSKAAWTISGLVLKTGLNTFTVQMLDLFGNVIGTTTYTVTKSGNALPVARLSADPSSGNVRLGQTLTLEANGSYDPDATALSFAWTHSPALGVSVSAPAWTTRQAIFDTPGIYDFTVTATDQAGAAAQVNREFLAYNAADFSPMNGKDLEPYWTAQNVQERAVATGTAWYSTQEKLGTLLVQILDDAAKPVAFPTATHPVISRPLPATSDFALQTDLNLEARQSGSFFTGLVVDGVESGVAVRYLFGIENGTQLVVKRSAGGTFTNLGTLPFTEGEAVIRVRRIGNQLRFQRRSGGVWGAAIANATLPSGSTAAKGGVFVATSIPQSVRVSFDYIVLADPTNTTTVSSSLRITEMMYLPASPDTVEYIELKNVGTSLISLAGVRFDDGTPFDAYTFGEETLAPGAFIVLTNNVAAFRARYGDGPRLAGAWPGGALNNAGERVVLRDAQENVIHDYIYDDVAPWPVAARGGGPSLEIVNPVGDYQDPLNWRASGEMGGSPGSEGVGLDTDGDGVPDSVEQRFGTDPGDAGSKPHLIPGVNASGQPTVQFPSVAGRQYRIEYRDDLTSGDWQTMTTVTGAPDLTTVIDTSPKNGQRFYRAVALP
jgi:hypothetical protein